MCSENDLQCLEPILSMEHHLEPKRNLGDQQCGSTEKTMLPHASNRWANPQGRFKQEKPNLSYANHQREITQSINNVSPKSSWNHQKQHAATKATEDELIKYMSRLPSYLERGKNPQEKVLNVGVLEWGRLEKWQYSHKQVSHRSSISSLSNSNASSSFFTEESSARSSRVHSCSPTHQRAHRPSLQSHLMSSPKEGNLYDVKSFGNCVRKPQDLNATQGNTINGQGKSIGENKSFIRNHPLVKGEQFKQKDTCLKIKSECGTSGGVNFKVNIVRQDTGEKFQQGNSDNLKQDFSGNGKTVVLLQPRDFPKMTDFGASGLLDPPTNTRQPKAGHSQWSFAEKLNEAHHDEHNSDLSHSSPLEVDSRSLPQIKPLGPADAKNIEFSSERSCSVLRSAKTGCSPARSRNLEGKVASMKPTVNEPVKRLDPKASNVASEKVRSTAPFHRFSFSIGKRNKTSSSKDTLAMPQLNSACTSAKCDSDIPVASHYASTYGRKTNAASKGMSSPLRRLLDPLLKPKAVNCSNIVESVQKHSISTEWAGKLSHGQPHSSTTGVTSGKVKSDTIRHSTVNASDLSEGNKHGLSVIQALLRVQVKNGMPLFTFVGDNESDILAATMKMFGGSSKDDHGCIFTFFSTQKVREKNGRWINQGGKGKVQDSIPNIVAQMKVSGSDISHLPRENCIDQFRVIQFVLLGVDIEQANHKTPDFQQYDELVAIILKIPKRSTRSSTGYGYQTDVQNIDSHKSGLKDCLPGVNFDSDFVINTQNRLFLGHQDIGATTVLLPSGMHSLPSRGGPSSLVKRWMSGGSCDCGGWDLGCKLNVLSNGKQLSKRLGSTKCSSKADPFELFFEGGQQEKRPFFNMAPFKDGIYSVEFNSSLSLLQAFSICIAVWESRRLCESINSFEERTLLETVLVQNDGIKAPNLTEGEASARYVSYPPLSPFGRI